MAKIWQHAKDRVSCGYDRACWIAKGEPYLLMTGPGWQKARCAQHAGQPVPDVIDEPMPLSFKTPSSFTPARELAKVLPMGPKRILLDAKQKQTGESE